MHWIGTAGRMAGKWGKEWEKDVEWREAKAKGRWRGC